jgi:osmotically inducible lipoprotein OsmB
MTMKLTLTSILAAVIASIGLGGAAGVSRQDQHPLAGAGSGGGAGALLPDDGADGSLDGAAVGGIIGRLITPNDDGRGNDQPSGYRVTNGPGYSSRSRQSNGLGYGNGYNSGDRYHRTSNEWLGS